MIPSKITKTSLFPPKVFVPRIDMDGVPPELVTCPILSPGTFIIRKSKFPQNPKRSVRFSGKRTKRSVQKRKARNTQKAETKVL